MSIREIEEARRIQEELRNARRNLGELQNANEIYDDLANHRNKLLRNDFEDLRRNQNLINEWQNHRNEVQRLREFSNIHNNFGLYNKLISKNEFLEPIRSLHKMLERERSFIGNSLSEARKNFQGINRITEQNYRNSIFQTEKEIEQIRRNYTQDRNELDRIRKDNLNGLPKWQEQLIPALSIRRNEAENIINNIKQFKEQIDLLPRNFRRQEFWNEIDSLRNTYVGNLAISMRDAIFDSENEQEALGKLENLVEGKLESLPEDGFSRFELLTLVLSILSLILAFYQSGFSTYQIFDSQKSSQEQKANTEKVIQLLERIVKNTDEAEETENVYYVVERDVSVKKKPNFKSTTIDFLSTGTKVCLLKSNHKWIFIEYIDYFEVVPKYGWVNKKYLTRIQKGKSPHEHKIAIDESDSWSDEDLYDLSNASLYYADKSFEESDK